jgi:hypothetical protein
VRRQESGYPVVSIACPGPEVAGTLAKGISSCQRRNVRLHPDESVQPFGLPRLDDNGFLRSRAS